MSEERLRIALLTRSLGFGGAERQITAVGRGLSHRHHVDLYAFYGGGGLWSDASAPSLNVHDLGKGHRWNVVFFLHRLITRIVEGDYDVVYTFNWGPNLAAALLKPFCRSARFVWGVRSADVDFRRYSWFVRAADVVQHSLNAIPDLVIANSCAGRRQLIGRGYPESRVTVVPNGIDTDRFHPDEEARRAVRAELGYARDDRVIGMVSRLHPMKGHENFLRAISLLSEEFPVEGLIIGEGPASYREHLDRVVEQLGLSDRIRVLPFRKDVEDIYRAMDLHVSSSSDGEGFSNAIGEAMASGVPCVATDVGDSRRVIGDSGWSVPPRDPSALAHAMKLALEDDRDLGFLARTRIVEHFSLERLWRNTERELRRAL